MTTYYKGNNIGLNYDAAAGSWSFTNTPKDFIDPNAFSTPDPVFPTAPTVPDASIPEPPTDPCPPGYMFDKELQQCVPDPNYQNPFRQDNQGGGNEQPFQPGTGKELPKGVNYNPDSLFPYSTDAPTRAQQNEHMLLQSGISLGWLQDNGQGQYIKAPFNEKQGEGIGWAGAAMKYFNKKSYDDYFKILENGWQPEGKGLWDKFLRGNTVYSLKPNENGQFMKYAVSDRFNRLDEDFVYDFSPEFKKKITQAQSIDGGMIDRDGNVNINADNKGGYYREDGKFVLNNGQVVSFGSLSAGLNYLSLLKNSQLKGTNANLVLSETLKKRLAKAIKGATFDPSMLPEGFSVADAEDVLKNYKQKKSETTDVNLGLTTDDKKEDGSTDVEQEQQQSKERDRVRDEYKEKGTVTYNTQDTGGYVTTPNQPSAPPGEQGGGGYTGSTSSGSSSSGNNYPNTPPPGTPSSPPSSAGEAFERYGRF